MSDTNKRGISGLFRRKWFAMLIAILLSFSLWLYVITTLSPEIDRTIHDIPVQIGTASSAQLQPVEGTEATATLKISGNRFRIAGLKPEDFTIVADASKVSSANFYQLPLSVVMDDNAAYSVISLTPETIGVRFDRILTKELSIEPNIEGFFVPDGYICNLDTDTVVTPATVTVEGPEDVVGRIVSARISHTFTENLTASYREEQTVEYLDANGEVVQSNLITSSADYAQLNIKVHRITQLPLAVSFINIPAEFPIEELSYQLSNTEITVAAEDSVLDNYDELMVGYINFKQLDLTQGGTITFDMNLPDSFINVNNIESVVAQFNTEGITSTTLNLKNFVFTNVPDGYTVSLATEQLNNVTFIGKKADINRLAANDVIIEVDMSERDMQIGQYQVSAAISAPTSGFVWAIGDHKVVVNVTAE